MAFKNTAAWASGGEISPEHKRGVSHKLYGSGGDFSQLDPFRPLTESQLNGLADLAEPAVPEPEPETPEERLNTAIDSLASL